MLGLPGRAGLDEWTPRASHMELTVAWDEERIGGEPCQIRLHHEKMPTISHDWTLPRIRAGNSRALLPTAPPVRRRLELAALCQLEVSRQST